VLNFILQTIFQSAQHLYEKKGSGSGPIPLTNGPDPGVPETSGSPTRAGLEKTRVFLKKPSPVGFFGFFGVFWGFLGFFGFFWVFLPRREGF
jgi:hypothetical protein